jgi:carbon monoxide dehydrogenase subunit G
VRIHFSVEIARPIEEVFAYLADPHNVTEWQDATVGVQFDDDAPVAIGTRYEQEIHIPGRQIDSTVEVTAHEPPHLFSIRSSGGPLDFAVEHRLEASGEGTRVTVEAEGEAKGVLRFAGPMMGPMVAHGMKQDFERLKRIVEER